MTDETWWRIGRPGELDSPPTLISSSRGGRFDDPEGRFVTTYFADSGGLCACEILASFRPNLAAYAEIATLPNGPQLIREAGVVDLNGKLGERVLYGARVRPRESRRFASITTIPLRQELAARLVDELVALGVDHLDIGEVMTNDYETSQFVAGALWDMEFAGVRYFSKMTNGACLAAFLDRCDVIQEVEPCELRSEPVLSDFIRPACELLGLKLVV